MTDDLIQIQGILRLAGFSPTVTLVGQPAKWARETKEKAPWTSTDMVYLPVVEGREMVVIAHEKKLGARILADGQSVPLSEFLRGGTMPPETYLSVYLADALGAIQKYLWTAMEERDDAERNKK